MFLTRLFIFLLILSLGLSLPSCGDDDSTDPQPTDQTPDPDPDPDPNPDPSPTGDSGNPPPLPNRVSEPISNSFNSDFDDGGVIYYPIDQIESIEGVRLRSYLTQSGKGVTNNARLETIDQFGFLVDEVTSNGQEVNFFESNLDLALFFSLDGTIDIYQYGEENWIWGYWFLNQAGNRLIINPNTSNELTINILSLNPFSLTVILTDSNGNSFEVRLNSYTDGVETSNEFSPTLFQNLLLSSQWYGHETFFNGNLIELNRDVSLAFFGNDIVYFDNIYNHSFENVILSNYQLGFESFALSGSFSNGDDFYALISSLDEESLVAIIANDEGFSEILFRPLSEQEIENSLLSFTGWSLIGEATFGNYTEYEEIQRFVQFSSNSMASLVTEDESEPLDVTWQLGSTDEIISVVYSSIFGELLFEEEFLFLGQQHLFSIGEGEGELSIWNRQVLVTPEQEQALLLTAEGATWSLVDAEDAVTVDGTNSIDWDNFTLQFSGDDNGGAFTTTNSASPIVWPSTGTWAFASGSVTQLQRNDGVAMTVNVTETNLTLSFEVEDPGSGRANGFGGNWIFKLGR